MRKFSLFISIMSIVAGGIGAWQLNSLIKVYENHSASISKSKKSLAQTEKAIDDFSKEHAVRYSRERRKNQEMEEQLLEISTEKSELGNLFASKNAGIENLKKSKEKTEQQIVDLRVELLSVDKQISDLKEQARSLQSEIPLIEEKIQNIGIQCEEQINRSMELSTMLSDYAHITRVLKEHYDRTKDALFRDKYERPWIERGEMIRLQSFSLDLEKGLLGLPVGKEIGLEPGAFLSIGVDEELICKIRIKEAKQRKSIAFIMPLFGNPEKLMEIDRFDLKHL